MCSRRWSFLKFLPSDAVLGCSATGDWPGDCYWGDHIYRQSCRCRQAAGVSFSRTCRIPTYRGQNRVNAAMFGGVAERLIYLVCAPSTGWVFFAILALSLLAGALLVMPSARQTSQF